MREKSLRLARYKRHQRIRKRVVGTLEKPRLCVFRSLNHMYAQIVDDSKGHTLAAASTLESLLRQKTEAARKSEAAALLGSLIAERALQKGISQVVFDRGGYQYHGRVRALADAAREKGLHF